jgi:hypothetical protein
VPSKYKTRLCKQYHYTLYCPYGNRCQFVHSTRDFQMLGEVREQGQEVSENSSSPMKILSYKELLEENLSQMKRRI